MYQEKSGNNGTQVSRQICSDCAIFDQKFLRISEDFFGKKTNKFRNVFNLKKSTTQYHGGIRSYDQSPRWQAMTIPLGRPRRQGKFRYYYFTNKLQCQILKLSMMSPISLQLLCRNFQRPLFSYVRTYIHKYIHMCIRTKLARELQQFIISFPVGLSFAM
jgi:hypothetical protein